MTISQSLIDKAIKAYEKYYDCAMIVTGFTQVDGEVFTEEQESEIYTNEPCKLSNNKGITNVSDGDTADISYFPTLYCNPYLEIPPGSKIQVTGEFGTLHFVRSGEGFKYRTHQVVAIERDDKA